MSYKYILITILILLLNACHPRQSKVIDKGSTLNKEVTTIAFGSCNKQYEDQSYWLKIKEHQPDVFVWMGDIIYADTKNPTYLKEQYDKQKSNPYYIDFRKNTKIIGIWDDHDFGVNDGGRSNPIKDQAKEHLFSFLDIPKNDPSFKRAGAYQSYTFGKGNHIVKIYLLDGRYFRTELSKDPTGKERYLHDTTGTLLGETQWKWLAREVKSSKANVNIFVSGIQVIPSQHRFEKWENFPKERIKLLSLIRDSGVKNPYIWSGDRHVAEISKYTDSLNTFSIYDITSSGLTHSYEKANEENKFRVSPLIGQKNYGLLTLDWAGDSLHIKHTIMGFEDQKFIELEQTVKL